MTVCPSQHQQHLPEEAPADRGQHRRLLDDEEQAEPGVAHLRAGGVLRRSGQVGGLGSAAAEEVLQPLGEARGEGPGWRSGRKEHVSAIAGDHQH